MIRMLAAVLWLAWLPAAAGQLIEVTEGVTTPIALSTTDLNRIRMAGGERLRKAWARKSQAEIQSDADTGQIVIRPLVDMPFTLHVQTARDATYSLLVTPRRIPGETVFLRDPAAIQRETVVGDRVQPYVARLKQWMRRIALGGLPSGAAHETVIGVAVPWGTNLSLRVVERYVSERIDAELVQVTNTGMDTRQLDERALAEQDAAIAAVAILSPYSLEPGRSADAILVRRAHR